MASSRKRTLAGLALAVVGVLGLAACTSSAPGAAAAHPPAGTPHDVVLASVAKTGTTSAHMTIAVTVSGTPSLGLGSSSSSAPSLHESIDASGDFNFVSKSGQMTMTLPSIAGGGTSTMEFRVVGQTAYLHLPAASSLVGDKPWIKVDLSSYEAAVGSDSTDPLGGATSGDPTQFLQLLDKLGAQVTEVGAADVGGVPTTEYRGTIDLSKVLGQGAGASGGAGAASSLTQGLAQAFGLGAIPVSVWVDNEGRARQVTMNMALFGIHLDMTLGLSDFGEAVTVTPPPADQVADGSSLLQGGQLKDILKSAANISA
ncbi:MAG TPA: hypothetical protein VMU09_08640 [Acidimicrobiales bacterium]|nr:hypothetical protein [Acidimicrobiales bacterium]